MDAEEFEELIVATIQETQVKLGFVGGTESLYLPLSSVSRDEDPEEIKRVVSSFLKHSRPRLGDVRCDILEGRVRVTVPEEGGRYVSKLPVSPVLRLMVDAVGRHLSVEQLREELNSRFPSHKWKSVPHGEDGFEYVLYFEDGTDASVYCIGVEVGHLMYHRFSRSDYEAFGFGRLREFNIAEAVRRSMRLIIYTGKGGVGKTSASAATAFRLAELGYRTLLMSTDSAHSLGDSIDFPLTTSVTPVRENLDALEIDIIHEMRTKWNDIQDYVSAFMLSQGMGEISAEEMAILPGMEMISALFYVNTFAEKNLYDAVVMDTAPTGETLRLMSFPDVTNWYLDKGFPIFRRLLRIAKATVGKLMDMPLPSEEVIDSVENIKDNMSRVKSILEDPEKTTVRLVLNPEKMVIRETMRAYTYLSLFNKNVDALVVNRVIPDEVGDSEFFAEKLREQKENMELIHSAFDPMKIMYCGMMRTELRGEEKLREMARMMYGDGDPAETFSKSSPMSFRSDDSSYFIEMLMPFTEGKDVELYRTGDATLSVRVGSQKRNLQLPDVLVHEEAKSAEFKDGKLIIRFGRGNGTEE